MPHAIGHIAAPSIAAVGVGEEPNPGKIRRKDGIRRNTITTETFLRLDTVTPGCSLYFTTDGLTPNPFIRFVDGIEKTFKYKGPFKLRPGTRVISVVAVCRANRRTSQESKRIFDVIDVSNEAETTVSSTSSSTTNDFDFHESNMVPHILTTDSSDSAKNYHYSLDNSRKETYFHSQYPANRRESDADWSSTLSDIYTDMTTQSKEIETMKPAEDDFNYSLHSYFDSRRRMHDDTLDCSDVETEVSNYFRRSNHRQQKSYEDRVPMLPYYDDSHSLAARDYLRQSTSAPRVRFQTDDSRFALSGTSLYATNPSLRASHESISSAWTSPLFTEKTSAWDVGKELPYSHSAQSQSGGAISSRSWTAGTRSASQDKRQKRNPNGGHNLQRNSLNLKDETDKKKRHENEDIFRKESLHENHEQSGSSTTSSSISSSGSSQISSDEDTGKIKGKNLGGRNERSNLVIGKKSDGAKKDKDRKGKSEKDLAQEDIKNEKLNRKHEKTKIVKAEKSEAKTEEELKERLKNGKHRSEMENDGVKTVKRHEKIKHKDISEESKKDLESMKRTEMNAQNDHDKKLNANKVDSFKSGVRKENGFNFVNDSGTQINVLGASSDDILQTVNAALLPEKSRSVHQLSNTKNLQLAAANQSNRHAETHDVASGLGSSVGKFSNSSSSPVARVHQHEQQSMISSAKKFFKGWGKPKTVEQRKTVKEIKGSSDSKLDFKDILKSCLSEKKLWEDPDFPAENHSLYMNKPPISEKIVWKRPPEICDSPQMFVSGASRFDVHQGVLGDCWLLAAIASLTSDEKLLQRVVPVDQSFDNNYSGIFHFFIWRYGTWLDVCIDDQLPTVNGKLIYMHSKEKNEFWSALLEKAYAKICGSYEALSGGLASEAMTDFTGGIVERYNFREELPDNFLQILLKAADRHSLMTCSIEPENRKIEDRLENGLIVGHAYSITGVKEISLSKGEKIGLVRVRNPWGNEYEWKGAWSDQSSEWNQLTEEQKTSLGLVFDHDGEFWMSFRDFTAYFHQVEICYLGPDELENTDSSRTTWLCSIQEGSWKKNVNAGGCRNYQETFWKNPQYHINITDADDNDEEELGTIVVGLLQKGGRKRRMEGRNLLTIGYDIYKVENSECKVISKEFFRSRAPAANSPSYSDMREVCSQHRLPPGDYIIVPTTFDPGEEADFILRLFTEKEHRMIEIDEETSIIRSKLVSMQNAESNSDAEKRFTEVCGDDETIDAFELQAILNNLLPKDFGFCQFDLNLCRSLVAMNDINHSGLLDLEEFKHVWKDLQIWKITYQQFDHDSSGYFNSFELREALKSVGFQLSNATFSMIVARYSSKDGLVHFDDFVATIVKLRTMFDIFSTKCRTDGVSKADFTMDEFIQMTVYS